MKLSYTDADDDIKFLCYAAHRDTEFARADALLLEDGQTRLTELDAIIAHIFRLHGEEPTDKSVADFKKTRSAPRPAKGAVNVLSLLNYINVVKRMLETGSLKDKDFIDEFTASLGFEFCPDFFLLEIKAGRIQQIETVEGMDKIYREQVLADRVYTICSGLREHCALAELDQHTFLFVLNMKPAKFRGTESEGMICCTKDDSRVEPLAPAAEPNTRLHLEGHLALFEGIKFAPIDISKAKYKAALGDFKVVHNYLTFRGAKVTCAGKYIKTAVENGPVS
ncbi:aminoacyl tRNA synthase complex-interacting multifunctional protein 1 [Pancytospora philotis]|nr:aminoacyl tRNA synthase complex-interacting multifunctional protein 1 [Pancytospora philotis]